MGVNYLKDISVDILLCGACTLWHYSEIVIALKVVFDFVLRRVPRTLEM